MSELENAGAAYQGFLMLWKDADTDILVLVAPEFRVREIEVVVLGILLTNLGSAR